MMTRRRLILRVVAAPLVFITCATITILAGSILDLGRDVVTTPTERQITPAERLVDRHDCWTGTPPADMVDQVPGHVVATTRTGRTVYSTRLVGPALEQLFDGTDHGLTVHAFCR